MLGMQAVKCHVIQGFGGLHRCTLEHHNTAALLLREYLQEVNVLIECPVEAQGN